MIDDCVICAFLPLLLLLFALGSAVQICHLPDEWRLNALVSATFYALSIQLLAEGVMRRAGLHLRLVTHASMFALVLAGMYYFSFVTPNLLVRIYILNFSAGLLMLSTAIRFRKHCHGRIVNHVLLWVLLIFGVSFFIRTSLTTIQPLPHSAAPFARTMFWVLLQLSLALMGAVVIGTCKLIHTGGADKFLDYLEVVHVLIRRSHSSGSTLLEAGQAHRSHHSAAGLSDQELSQGLASRIRAVP
ncbi:hypothetical protein AB6809_30495 [Paraburkholderia sp. RCC_158]|uniref:hypothetical protein n=1 Tax=Paraburkholderia sp. RCC_158 TaxID=3239220 RepID=UPI0035244E64